MRYFILPFFLIVYSQNWKPIPVLPLQWNIDHIVIIVTDNCYIKKQLFSVIEWDWKDTEDNDEAINNTN